MALARAENIKIDAGKLISSVFGKHDDLSFIYFGVDEDWKFANSLKSSLKKFSYMYCGKNSYSYTPDFLIKCGSDAMSFSTDKKADAIIVDLNELNFSTIIYMSLEGMLKEDGILCINGPGSYRYPLFKAMMKEGIIDLFGQNEFEERGIVIFRKQNEKFSRIF